MSPEALGLVAAMSAGAGVHLITSGPRAPRRRLRALRRLPDRARRWLRQAGLDDVGPTTFLAISIGAGSVAGIVSLALFGGPLVAATLALVAASAPGGVYRRRRRHRADQARDAWPRLIEEVRVLTGSAGRSIPQALFEAGRRAPASMRAAFEAAEHEWLRTTDLGQSLAVLVDDLADPAADAVAETVLVAHEVGGSGLDARLAALAEDRRRDQRARAEAQARLAGARFARWFVLAVPAGMALAGLAIGDGRAAYASPGGQVGLLGGVAVVAGCWWWSERLMRPPAEPRVLAVERRGSAR